MVMRMVNDYDDDDDDDGDDDDDDDGDGVDDDDDDDGDGDDDDNEPSVRCRVKTSLCYLMANCSQESVGTRHLIGHVSIFSPPLLK